MAGLADRLMTRFGDAAGWLRPPTASLRGDWSTEILPPPPARPASRLLLAALWGVGALLGMAALAPARAQDPTELLIRLDRLETENRRLNGQVEQLGFQLRRLEDQLKRFQADAEFRFREIEGGRPGNRPPPPGPQGAAPPGSLPQATLQAGPTPRTPRRQDAFDPDQNPSAPGAPRPLPQTGVGSPPGNLSAGSLSTGNDPAAPLDVTSNRRPPGPAPAGPAIPGDARSEYDYARALIDRGDLELSEAAFRDFLRAYPQDRRVADATFWLGESYLRRTRYREAAEQYLNVTTKHANAQRAPEAMLKLGISLRGLGANTEACGTFDQVGRKYPNASPAIRQAVEREKVRAQC